MYNILMLSFPGFSDMLITELLHTLLLLFLLECIKILNHFISEKKSLAELLDRELDREFLENGYAA